MMKRIITVQDMIDELMLVVNKDAEINIVMNTGDYQTEYIPDLYDFSVIDLLMYILMMETRKIKW